ncbi:MAG: TIGR00341 family protein [Legionellaceae bacterium]|nr:TIGR00341 family protein [Legionellaceae bacterium]
MALRLIEIVLKKEDTGALEQFLNQYEVIEYTKLALLEKKILFRILVSTDIYETVLAFLDEQYIADKDNRVTVITVEATLPLTEAPDNPLPQVEKALQGRVATEELYEDVKDASECSKIYMMMVVLSTLVTAVGLYNNNVVVLLGGMLIAPILGPIIGLALSFTLSDVWLFKRSLLTGLSGIAIALLLSTFLGMLVEVNPALSEIALRTQPVRGDLLVALASGCAGALAFTTGVPATLIGVMVAVSLLPPLVTTGLLLGNGHHELVEGAFALFLMNFISVNVAGVIVFLIQGIYPRSWSKNSHLTKVVRAMIIALWLCILIGFLVFFRIHFLMQ